MKTDKEDMPTRDDKESGRRTYNTLYQTKGTQQSLELS